MAIKNSIKVYIDGINRTSSVVMPLKWGDFLDERLDECHLALRGVKKKSFTTLTPVEIEITNEQYWGSGENKTTDGVQNVTKHFIIANDSAIETPVGSGRYNHDLYLIEVTKAAECVVVDTITFTNNLGKNYTEDAPYAQPDWE